MSAHCEQATDALLPLTITSKIFAVGTLVSETKSSSIDKDKSVEKQRVKNDKRLEKEYARIRRHFEEVRQAYLSVENAESHDDIYFRLKQLEKRTRRVRTGGMLTRGAKTHHRLLRKMRTGLR